MHATCSAQTPRVGCITTRLWPAFGAASCSQMAAYSSGASWNEVLPVTLPPSPVTALSAMLPQNLGGDEWRDHAKVSHCRQLPELRDNMPCLQVLLQLYEEGSFVFKASRLQNAAWCADTLCAQIRHWSEDASGSQSYEHANAWYTGNFGRIGSGSVLRRRIAASTNSTTLVCIHACHRCQLTLAWAKAECCGVCKQCRLAHGAYCS